MSNYMEQQWQHRQALLDLGAALTAALSEADLQPWTMAVDETRDAPQYLSAIDLTRADGLALRLYWASHDPRPSVYPQVPQIEGRYRDTTSLGASFAATRPPAAIAKDVLRRVVMPWQQELPQIRAKQQEKLDQRSLAIDRATRMARALGSSLPEGAAQLVADSIEVQLGLGSYGAGIDVDVKVSTHSTRATFKVEIEGDEAFSLELAELLKQRFAERLARDGKSLCSGCHIRAIEHGGPLCSRCAYHERRREVA